MGPRRERGRSSGARPVALGFSLGLVLAVVAAGCAIVPRAVPVPAPRPAVEERPCSIARVRSCALPYPSDEITVADPLSGTGRRIELPEGLIPDGLARQLGPGATPAETFEGADGFAALTPVIFEVERPVLPPSIPADGGDVLALFDLDTGERVPIRAEVPAEAVRHGRLDSVVVAWPRTRLEFGHRYVARLTDGVRLHEGGRLTKPAGLRADSDWVRSLREALESVEGDRWDEVVSATRFTVRSEANATAQLDGMAAIARSEDHPIRRLRVHPALLVEGASAIVTGEVQISDFRDEHGVARVEHGSTPRWVRFQMILPEEPAGVDGAPVVIYGHGLTVAKETMLVTASSNARMGLATVGIDVPNHGDRQAGVDRAYLFDLISPRHFGRVASMPLQGIVDHVSLLGAVQDHFGDLELDLPNAPGGPGGPAPTLDTSRILYQGTSMGGVLGAGFTSISPELDGSFLQVAGSGTADIIYHSLLWPLFMNLVPAGASTGDAYALMGAATMLLDGSDNVNVLHRARTNDSPVFLMYGIGDGIVQNFASERLVRLLDLPLVGAELRPLAGVPRAGESVPADGWGVAQIWSNSSAELRSFAAHGVGGEPRAKRVLEEWLASRLDALGVEPG